MSLVDDEVDSWLSEFNSLERLTLQIQNQISERDSKSSVAEYNKISARIRIQLKQFDNELNQLEKKLLTLGRNGNITDAEKERRVRQLEQLSSKKIQLNSRFQNTTGSSSRSELFEEASKRNGFNEDTDDEPIINSTAPVEVLRSEQKQIIKEQDSSLDNLSKTILRQKDIAIRIGSEVDRQNDILDDIAEQIDNTDTRMSSTTRGVEEVSRRDSTWTYWLIIMGLFLAIIVVVIL